MKKNIRKAKMISKITGQITEFYLENGAENVQIKIDKNNNEYTVCISGHTGLSSNKVEEIKKSMSIHHDTEYDEYWELMGEGENTDELVLVARICDSVHISYEENILKMTLKKNF